MKRILKRAAALLGCVVIGAALPLAGCGNMETKDQTSQSRSRKLRLLLLKKNRYLSPSMRLAHSIFYAPMYVAIEEGYFAEEGIDLDLVCGFGADKVMTAVLSGEADIGFMGSEATVYTANQGAGRPGGEFRPADPAGG